MILTIIIRREMGFYILANYSIQFFKFPIEAWH
jgi:hypothetical protein